MATTLEFAAPRMVRYACSVHRREHGPEYPIDQKAIPGWFCPLCAREQAASAESARFAAERKAKAGTPASGDGWEVLNG